MESLQLVVQRRPFVRSARSRACAAIALARMAAFICASNASVSRKCATVDEGDRVEPRLGASAQAYRYYASMLSLCLFLFLSP